MLKSKYTKYEINGKESIARIALVSDIDFRAQTLIVGDLQLSATIIRFNSIIVSSLVIITHVYPCNKKTSQT